MSSRQSTQPPLPSPSWLLRIAAMLVLLAPLGSTLHLVGTAHHVCPEHGEVEHGAGPHARPPHAGRSDAAPTEGAQAVVDTVPSYPAHEHCDTVGLLKSASRLPPIKALLVNTGAPSTPAFLLSRPACVGTSLLDFAPKTSPPVAA